MAPVGTTLHRQRDPGAHIRQAVSVLKWKASEPSDPSRQSLLTILTIELRLMVLEELLISNYVLRRVSLTDDSKPLLSENLEDRVMPTEIMSTCSALHFEAARAFYPKNTFKVTEQYFLHSTGLSAEYYAPLVRKLEISAWYFPPFIGIPYQREIDEYMNKNNEWVCLALKTWVNTELLTFKLQPTILELLDIFVFRTRIAEKKCKHGVSTGLARSIRDVCNQQKVAIPRNLKIALAARAEDEVALLLSLDEMTVLANKAVELAKTMRPKKV